MNVDEVVRALHKYAKNAQENLEVDTMRDFDSAADLIESLQAQHKQAALNYQQKCRDVVELEAHLAASQRREKAAVEDIYKMKDGGECDICKHYNPGKNTCAKPFVPYDDCFEWRGLERSE